MVVLWSGAFVAVTAALRTGLRATDLVVLRTLIATPAFALLWWLRRPSGLTRRDARTVIVGGVLGVGAYQLLLTVGAARTSAGTVTLVVAATPAITLLLARTLGMERLSRGRTTGITLAFVGVGVVSVAAPGQGLAGGRLAGIALLVASAVTWAAYTVVLKPLLERADGLAVTAVSSIAGGLVVLPLVDEGTFDAIGSMSLRQALLLGFLALGITVLGYLAWNEGVRGLDPSRASAYLYLTTPLSLVLATVLLDEAFSVWLVLSLGLVLAGVILAQRS